MEKKTDKYHLLINKFENEVLTTEDVQMLWQMEKRGDFNAFTLSAYLVNGQIILVQTWYNGNGLHVYVPDGSMTWGDSKDVIYSQASPLKSLRENKELNEKLIVLEARSSRNELLYKNEKTLNTELVSVVEDLLFPIPDNYRDEIEVGEHTCFNGLPWQLIDRAKATIAKAKMESKT